MTKLKRELACHGIVILIFMISALVAMTGRTVEADKEADAELETATDITKEANEIHSCSITTQEISVEPTVVPTTVVPTKAPEPTQLPKYNLTDDEKYMLAKIAMAEAEGEDKKSKALVILTVLNRVSSDDFPDRVEDVILQRVHGVYQFSPVGNGRYKRVEPNKECYEALEMVLDGYDESQEALYFTSEYSRWHEGNTEKIFTYNNFTFYK